MNILEAVRPKILRAMDHANEIETAWTKYVKPYETFLEPQNENERWEVKEEPPKEIAVLAGELLYQVRSTLDHLFFELVQLNQRNIVLRPGWERDCQFPIYSELPLGVSAPPVPRSRFPSPARDWLSDRAYNHIESLQPYYKSNEGDFLRIISQLSNIDKHRRLNTIVISADITETATTASGQFSTTRLMVEPGTELTPFSPAPELAGAPMHLRRHIEPVISFNEPAVILPQNARVLDLVYELPDFALWVARNVDFLTRNP